MDLSSFRVVRLNSELFPITEFEREKYAARRIVPVEFEVQSPSERAAAVADADAVMVVSESLPAETIQAMGCCRVICRLGAGTDKIDVVRATECGIVVANVPDFCVEEQADHAFAMLLAVTRKLNEMRQCMLAAQYHSGRQQCRPLRRLPGRSLGLVGFGRSARAMARRARGFDMQILATRNNMSAVDPEVDSLGVRLVPLEQLLSESDFVSLHLPLDEQTRGLFDKQTLLRMKPGSVLINTARGAIVDEDALAELLEAGHLSGAGLDTFAAVDVHQAQPAAAVHPLFQMDNVVFTPHVAAFSADSSRDVGYGSVATLVDVLCGRWPAVDRIVNPGVQPRWPLAVAADR